MRGEAGEIRVFVWVKSKSCVGVQRVQNAFFDEVTSQDRLVRIGRGKERFQPGWIISDCFIFPAFG